MFERIGAFHLGTGHEEPIAALERELEHTDGTNALIVLPEAFNLGRHYSSEPGIPKFERDVVIRQLLAITRRLPIAFVVGLLEPNPEDSGRPHRSAYFISATQISLMCHKQRWDGSGHYSVCPEAPDRANPVIQDDASVIAAICMDVQDSQRFARVAVRAGHAEKKRNFVCIPAAMCDTSWFGGATLGSSQSFLKCELKGNGNLILANSDHRGVGSFITGPDWQVLACIEHERKAESRLLIAHAPFLSAIRIGVKHSVDVGAETLYEAAVLALKSFRENECAPGPASHLAVEVKSPSVTHTVVARKIEEWLDGGARSPKEAIEKPAFAPTSRRLTSPAGAARF